MRKMIGRFAGRAFVVILSFTLGLVEGASAQTETILSNFDSSNGSYSLAPLIFDDSGNLYGTTDYGGNNGVGVVFQLTNSAGTWTENVLWSFAGGTSDGCYPYAGLTMDSSGKLYGTTTNCGASNRGIVFELTNSGGTWSETVLHSFTGGRDGGHPEYGSLVIDPEGNLYGTTQSGGGGGCLGGCGVVFQLANNNGVWKETVLHKFRNDGRDGIAPEFNVMLDDAGNLYGTTFSGGAFGYGVAFKLSKTAKAWTEKLLHSFSSAGDGGNPSGGLTIDASSNLYGSTAIGGAYGYGTVFELSQTRKKWSENVIHSFVNTDGSYPLGNLTFDSAGNLYGTAYDGGSFNLGAVFALTKSGGSWTETVLWNFDNNGTDGWNSHGVILDSSGNLYGITQQGGRNNYGIVYEIAP
jgi:uncharacterized repeat protein (TIGR03803 family)